MSRLRRIAPVAILAACGVCALLAAVALAGWSPRRRLARAGAVRSHHASACTHTRSRARARRRGRQCEKARRHKAGSHGHSGSQGSTAPAGSTGGPASPGAPGTSTTTTPSPAGPGTGEGSTTPPPSTPEVQVSAVEYHYTLSRTTVPAGKVIIEFVDDGQDEHNLNAEGEGGALAATFATEDPKAVARKTVELHPGSYMLFCSLPEHEQKGMKATLTVE